MNGIRRAEHTMQRDRGRIVCHPENGNMTHESRGRRRSTRVALLYLLAGVVLLQLLARVAHLDLLPGVDLHHLQDPLRCLFTRTHTIGQAHAAIGIACQRKSRVPLEQ